jgi:hypothetical protein
LLQLLSITVLQQPHECRQMILRENGDYVIFDAPTTFVSSAEKNIHVTISARNMVLNC